MHRVIQLNSASFEWCGQYVNNSYYNPLVTICLLSLLAFFFPLPSYNKMADVPPVFADLGKAARDVFNKGFGKYMYVHNENQTNIRRECESEHVWHKLPCSLIEVVSHVHVHVLELYGVGKERHDDYMGTILQLLYDVLFWYVIIDYPKIKLSLKTKTESGVVRNYTCHVHVPRTLYMCTCVSTYHSEYMHMYMSFFIMSFIFLSFLHVLTCSHCTFSVLK